MKSVKQFRGEHSFLSNFQFFDNPMIYPDTRKKRGIVILTNEHFYQAMKYPIGSLLREDVATRPSKGLKSYVKSTLDKQLPNFEDRKLDVMLYGLRYKFSNNNPILRDMLLKTRGMELIEGNWWNDKYWGFCLKTGEGENYLGKLLMQVRGEI